MPNTNSLLRRPTMTFAGCLLIAPLVIMIAMFSVSAAPAHEIWIEADASATAGQEMDFHVYWGHAGNRESGDGLAAQHAKLTAFVHSAEGRETVKLTMAEDGFAARYTPKTPGYLGLGADLQVGIIDRPVHSIPAHTRIVMYAKAITRVAGDSQAAPSAIGLDLELIPIAPARQPRVGDLVTIRVLHQGKPIGGREVQVTAATSGDRVATDDPRVQNWQWSTEAMADPKTGEVTFPLIVAGQHLFTVRYVDETPGTYDGPRNDVSDFSHLRKGDTYQRTMHVSTLTMQVADR